MTDVGHKPGREKTARYIADNVPDPAPVKGADITAKTTRRQVTASIHAPVKGRLSISRVVVMTCRVSIHAPVKGRRKCVTINSVRRIVSIHAPVKGATCHVTHSRDNVSRFNPRPHEGATIVPISLFNPGRLFQSTPP